MRLFLSDTNVPNILVLIIIGCSSVGNKKNDLVKMNLHKKIKSIEETEFDAIEKFGEIIKEGNYKYKRVIIFNKTGNKKEERRNLL